MSVIRVDLRNINNDVKTFQFPDAHLRVNHGCKSQELEQRASVACLNIAGAAWGQPSEGAVTKHLRVRKIIHAAYLRGEVWVLDAPACWANTVALSSAVGQPVKYMACTWAVQERIKELLLIMNNNKSADLHKLLSQYMLEWGVSMGRPNRVDSRHHNDEEHLLLQFDMRKFNCNHPSVWLGCTTTRPRIYHLVGEDAAPLHVHHHDEVVSNASLTEQHHELLVMRAAHLNMSPAERAERYFDASYTCMQVHRREKLTIDMAWLPERLPGAGKRKITHADDAEVHLVYVHSKACGRDRIFSIGTACEKPAWLATARILYDADAKAQLLADLALIT